MLAALFAVVGLDRRGLSGLIPEGPVLLIEERLRARVASRPALRPSPEGMAQARTPDPAGSAS